MSDRLYKRLILAVILVASAIVAAALIASHLRNGRAGEETPVRPSASQVMTERAQERQRVKEDEAEIKAAKKRKAAAASRHKTPAEKREVEQQASDRLLCESRGESGNPACEAQMRRGSESIRSYMRCAAGDSTACATKSE